MGKEEHDFPISVSTGVFGLVHEHEQVPRIGVMLNVLPALQDLFSRPMGSEFNAVNVRWLEELWTMLASGISSEFVRMAEKGSVFSIHAPNDVPYNDFSHDLTKRTIAAVHRIQKLVPINHVVVHADLVEPGKRIELAEIIGKNVLSYENSDRRLKGFPVRYASEVGELATAGLQTVIDVGHVCHAGEGVIQDYGEIIQFQQAIAAYHISAVHGDDGMHYPLSSKHGKAVLQLLDRHQHNMNGAPRVLESPMPVGSNTLNFLSAEINLLLKPELGLVQ